MTICPYTQNGKGCAKDYAKALAWFKRRRPSCAGSQYNIGVCLCV